MLKYPELRLVVRTYELDSLGHVNNANYLNYLEVARVDLFLNEEYGLIHAVQNARGLMPMLVRVEINYRTAAVFGDELVIRHGLDHIGSKSLHIAYTMDNQHGQRVADGKVVMVFLDGTQKAVAISDPISDIIRSQLPPMSITG